MWYTCFPWTRFVVVEPSRYLEQVREYSEKQKAFWAVPYWESHHGGGMQLYLLWSGQ